MQDKWFVCETTGTGDFTNEIRPVVIDDISWIAFIAVYSPDTLVCIVRVYAEEFPSKVLKYEITEDIETTGKKINPAFKSKEVFYEA